jgi:hypothetical protein
VILWAIIWSLFFFPSAMIVAGPQGTEGDIAFLRRMFAAMSGRRGGGLGKRVPSATAPSTARLPATSGGGGGVATEAPVTVSTLADTDSADKAATVPVKAELAHLALGNIEMLRNPSSPIMQGEENPTGIGSVQL